MKEYRVEQENQSFSEIGVTLHLQTAKPGSVSADAHIHEAVELIYVVEGAYTVDLDGCLYEIATGDRILFRSNAIHRIIAHSDPVNRYYVLKFKPSILSDLAQENHAGRYALAFAVNRRDIPIFWPAGGAGDEDFLSAFSRFSKAWGEDAPCRDLFIRLYATEIFTLLLRDMLSHDSEEADENAAQTLFGYIYRTIRHINRHYAEDLTAKECGELVGMSYSYFSRSFKRVTGQSFKSYLNQVRVNQAERMLTETQKSVTEISTACGYNSVSYFISIYKSLKGKTPFAHRA